MYAIVFDLSLKFVFCYVSDARTIKILFNFIIRLVFHTKLESSLIRL